MNKSYIETEARKLLLEIWDHKESLWNWGYQPSLMEIAQPAMAAKVLGVEYLELPDLGDPRFAKRSGYQTAGLINRQHNQIAISCEFPQEIIKFTAGHEVGHWVLHPLSVMHRDIPLNGATIDNASRPLEEREADYFSSCFIMPAKLVIKEFQARFGKIDQFIFNEHTCFNLGQHDTGRLVHCEKRSLDREFVLAKCRSYAGKQFYSLAETFGVSVQAMAIRLKHLELVKWP